MESKRRWVLVSDSGDYWSYRDNNRVLANVYKSPLFKHSKNKWRVWVPGNYSFEMFDSIKAAAAYAENQVEFNEKRAV